jgi:hypothetical protein
MQKKLPDKLYKYEPFNEYSIKNLKNASLYFRPPKEFNDPFDCALLEESLSYSEEDLVALYNKRSKEEALNIPPIISKDQIPSVSIDKVKKVLKEFVSKKQKEFLETKGCTCFSETNNSILMWGHYANRHKGFCLEFNTNFDPFSGAKEVKYRNEYPIYNPIADILNDHEASDDDLFPPISTKYTQWEYEKEWRIFHQHAHTIYGYKVEALEAVYFGLNTDPAHLEIICLIIHGQNPNTKFFEARKGAKNFQIEFEEFAYIPHKEISNQIKIK